MGLDPMEFVNRYQYVGGNPTNATVGELGWMNGYAYVNGNPVNLTDPSGMIAETPGIWDPCQRQQGKECKKECCSPAIRLVLSAQFWLKNWCCECPGPETPIPTIIPTLGAVTATPGPTATQTATATLTATVTATPTPAVTPTATPGACPSNSLFGCYPNTATPIQAAWIPATHPEKTAADFVPDGAPSGLNPNWEQSPPYNDPAYRTVYAVVGGEVLTNLHGANDGNYRIRTDQTTTRGGNTYNICYEYLHLEPIPGISPASGGIIPAGTPLGTIERYQNDAALPLDANRGPSHVHVAIYPCNVSDPSMSLATGPGSQLDPLAVLSYTGGSSSQ